MKLERKALLLGMGLVLGCTGNDPAGVAERQVVTSCSLAETSGTSTTQVAAEITKRADSPWSAALALDDEWLRLAEAVPGGFAGAYLDDDGRFTVRLVDPSQRDAALPALQSLSFDADWLHALVVKADYDWIQLTRYYGRITDSVAEPGINLYDIDEVLNRIFLGVLDDEVAARVARGIVALGDVPCDAVLLKSGVEPAIPT